MHLGTTGGGKHGEADDAADGKARWHEFLGAFLARGLDAALVRSVLWARANSARRETGGEAYT